MKETRASSAAFLGVVLLITAWLFLSPSPSDHIVLADKTSTVLMSAQTWAGPGITSVGSQATPTEGGSDWHFFQYRSTNWPEVVNVAIQQSFNSGTTWVAVHLFGPGGPDEIWATGACGVCIFRAYKGEATTGIATVTHGVSGATVPLAVTYTPTATPTVTPTSTRTPTVTPTHT